MLESDHDPHPWSKPPSAATKQATHDPSSFVKQYTFHIDPTRDDYALMTTSQRTLQGNSTDTFYMEDNRESNATEKTTGSPSSGSPGTKPAVRGIEDIWKANAGSPQIYPERRRNELSSDDEIDDGGLGNGESRAGFISRRPSMTAELETRIRQVRLSEGSDHERHSGPNSPSTAPKWGLYGMNWTSQNTILGDRKTTPPQDQPPISPLARFQQSPFDPPAPRQVSPVNTNPGYSASRPRFPPPPALDPNQRVQRSQSFSVGDHGFGNNYLAGTTQAAPVGHRSNLFGEDPAAPGSSGRHFKLPGHTMYPASPLARAPIAEEVDEFDVSMQKENSKEESPSRYQDRGRSLSTSAASHGFTRQRLEGEDVIDNAIYEEEEDALQEFEPLSRSRTLPTENVSGQLSGLGFGGSRYSGLNPERERLERQRGLQSPRVAEDLPSRRQESYSSVWDNQTHRSPPRAVDYPAIQSDYDYESTSSITSPGSLQTYPGHREYPSADVQNYFNNDTDRRRMAAEQFQYYQMQSRYRHPMAHQHNQPHHIPFQNPDQYTLHIVKFKASRTDVFYLAKEKKLDLQVSDYVIVDGDRGTDLGMVSKTNVSEAEARSLTAQLQREQAAATAANQNGMNPNAMEAITAAANQVQERDVTIPKKFIHRLAVRGEIDGLQMKMQDEAQAKQVCEMKVQQRGLQMDILDVEYQWDRRKLYIYFIAPQRVDFVALVKDLFKIYKTRIWLHNSTASHVTSNPSFLQSAQHDTHDYNVPHIAPQYDYYRTQPRQSPAQQQYLPPIHQPMYSANLGNLGAGGYYSPHQQQYYPAPTRSYPPPQQPHMPFQSSGHHQHPW